MQLELPRSMQRQEGSNDAQPRPRDGDANALTRTAAKKRPWCERALGGLLLLWMQPAVAAPPAARAPLAAKAAEGRPGWCSSVKAAAAALARVVCLCAPVCSYDEVLLGAHVDAVAPTPRRRSGSCSHGLSPAAVPTPTRPLVVSPAAPKSPTRPSVAPEREGTARRRPSLRGKSLSDDALMRWFVQDEQAVRQPGEKEAILVKKRPSTKKWQAPGKSRLCRMSLADVAEEAVEENGLS